MSRQTTLQIASIVDLVAAGFGVAVVTESMSQLASSVVAFRPFLGGGPRAPLALARNADVSSLVADDVPS